MEGVKEKIHLSGWIFPLQLRQDPTLPRWKPANAMTPRLMRNCCTSTGPVRDVSNATEGGEIYRIGVIRLDDTALFQKARTEMIVLDANAIRTCRPGRTRAESTESTLPHELEVIKFGSLSLETQLLWRDFRNLSTCTIFCGGLSYGRRTTGHKHCLHNAGRG